MWLRITDLDISRPWEGFRTVGATVFWFLRPEGKPLDGHPEASRDMMLSLRPIPEFFGQSLNERATKRSSIVNVFQRWQGLWMRASPRYRATYHCIPGLE